MCLGKRSGTPHAVARRSNPLSPRWSEPSIVCVRKTKKNTDGCENTLEVEATDRPSAFAQSLRSSQLPLPSSLSNSTLDLSLPGVTAPRQAGRPTYYRICPRPFWPNVLRTSFHHGHLCPSSDQATTLRPQTLLDPRMPGCRRRCSPYAAYYPVCPMCEIITRLSCADLSPLVTICSYRN